jgi:hypothetical protein
VNVDAAGIGYYLAKHLQDLGYPVRLVNVVPPVLREQFGATTSARCAVAMVGHWSLMRYHAFPGMRPSSTTTRRAGCWRASWS